MFQASQMRKGVMQLLGWHKKQLNYYLNTKKQKKWQQELRK
jgi:hypothetical protein